MFVLTHLLEVIAAKIVQTLQGKKQSKSLVVQAAEKKLNVDVVIFLEKHQIEFAALNVSKN